MEDKENKKELYYSELFDKCSPSSIGTKEFEECCEDETSKTIKNNVEAVKNDIRQNSKEIIHKFLDKDDRE